MKDLLTYLQIGIAVWQIKRLFQTEAGAAGTVAAGVTAIAAHPLAALNSPVAAARSLTDPLASMYNAVEVAL
jgi:hypothetical protein